MRKRVNVLVAALALLVAAGLVAAALQKVRQEAQRTQCFNNLKHLSVALEAYHDTWGSFPAAAVPNDALPPGRRLSWLYDLDPFMVARMYPPWRKGVKKAWDDEVNRDIVRERLPYYLCPANPEDRSPDGPALTHYVGVAGLSPDAARLPESDLRAGVFGYDRQTSLKDITDGPATTLMVVETARENGPWLAGGPPTVRGLDAGRQPYVGKGGQFGGTHPGGAMAAFADGSVRLVPRSTSAAVLEGLAAVAGGEGEDIPFFGPD